jgi:hypothetical protein
VRFGLIKRAFPRITSGAVVEAPNEREKDLQETLSGPLTHADFISTSVDGLGDALKDFGRTSPASHCNFGSSKSRVGG